MRIISYNLREHTARGELEAMADGHDVDVLARLSMLVTAYDPRGVLAMGRVIRDACGSTD